MLCKKHIVQDATCQVCNGNEETPDHIIGGCAIGVSFWERLNLNSMVGIQHQNLLRGSQVTQASGCGAACWALCRETRVRVSTESLES